jgi:hypothetical protein
MNIPTQLRALAAGLATIHTRMASKKEGRTWKTWGTLALCAVLVASFAQMGTPTGQEATLTAPTQVPISQDGKQVGSATLPVGAKVSILKENGDNVLIQAAMGEVWVEANKVEKKATPLPITNQVSVQKDTPTEKAEDKPIPPQAKQKKALIVLESATYSPLFGVFMQELKAREWEITIIAPNKTNIYPDEGFSGKKVEGDILDGNRRGQTLLL